MMKNEKNKLQDILKKYPKLNSEGICYNTDMVYKKSLKEIEKFNNECREALESRKDIIISISKILQKYIIPTKTIRTFYDSYQMKNIVEKQLETFGVEECCISHGEFVAAALLAGFKIRKCSYAKWNVHFNMQKQSFERTFHN